MLAILAITGDSIADRKFNAIILEESVRTIEYLEELQANATRDRER